MSETEKIDLKAEILKRVEEIKSERQVRLNDLDRQAAQLLAPYDMAVNELNKMLELLNEEKGL